MFAVVRALVRPWRVVRRVRVLKDTVVAHLRQVLDLQREVKAEVRDLHQSCLLAAIRVIEDQQHAREELARDYARLESRLQALERRLDAGNAPGAPLAEPNRGE